MFQSPPTRKYGLYMIYIWFIIIPNKPGSHHDVSNALSIPVYPSISQSCSSYHQPSIRIPSATASAVARISPPSSSAWAARSPSLPPRSAARPAATCHDGSGHGTMVPLENIQINPWRVMLWIWINWITYYIYICIYCVYIYNIYIYICVCVLLLGMRLILVHLHVSAHCRWFYPGISPLKWIYASLKLRDDTSSDDLNMGLSENSVPHCTQWLMIIIPMKNGYFIGNIPYFQTNPYGNDDHQFGVSPSLSDTFILFHFLVGLAEQTKQKKMGWLNSLQGIMNGKDRNQTNQTNQWILKPASRLRLWRIVKHLTSSEDSLDILPVWGVEKRTKLSPPVLAPHHGTVLPKSMANQPRRYLEASKRWGLGNATSSDVPGLFSAGGLDWYVLSPEEHVVWSSEYVPNSCR